MKFKNEKHAYEGEEARILTIADKCGDELTVRAYIDGKPQIVIEINGDNYSPSAVSLTRAKALKLAWAIVAELDPDYACIR